MGTLALWHLENTCGSEFKVVPTHGTAEAGFLAGVSMLSAGAWVELRINPVSPECTDWGAHKSGSGEGGPRRENDPTLTLVQCRNLCLRSKKPVPSEPFKTLLS